MEKIHAKGRRSEYRAKLALHRYRAKLISHKASSSVIVEEVISAFLSEFSNGLTKPLSLSVPKVKRERLIPLRVKTKLRGPVSDKVKLNGDMRRAMEHVVKIAR